MPRQVDYKLCSVDIVFLIHLLITASFRICLSITVGNRVKELLFSQINAPDLFQTYRYFSLQIPSFNF